MMPAHHHNRAHRSHGEQNDEEDLKTIPPFPAPEFGEKHFFIRSVHENSGFFDFLPDSYRESIKLLDLTL
jgi:hypothetical protein